MTSTPHDACFKAVYGQPEHAAGFFQAYLPRDLVEKIDMATLAPAKGSFVDKDLRQSHTDLLYHAQLAGKPALLYLLFDHRRTVDKWAMLQLLRYMERIWTQWLSEADQAQRDAGLPPIVTLVLYHGRTRWTAPTRFDQLLNVDESVRAETTPSCPNFEMRLLDLSAVSDADLKGTALGHLALLLFKHIDDPRLLKRLNDWADVFLRAANESGLRAMEIAVSYILQATDAVPPDRLGEWMAATVDQNAKEIVMTTAEKLRKEGREQGHKKGRKEGRKEGQSGLLLRLLELRFGALPADVVERVKAADPDTLLTWSDRILTATSLDDVLTEPRQER